MPHNEDAPFCGIDEGCKLLLECIRRHAHSFYHFCDFTQHQDSGFSHFLTENWGLALSIIGGQGFNDAEVLTNKRRHPQNEQTSSQ